MTTFKHATGRKLAAILTVAALVVTLGSCSSSADATDSGTGAIVGTLGSGTANCGSYTVPPNPGRVFMVGDSLTHRGTYDLHTLRRNWEINGRAGRNVDCLPAIVAERMRGSRPIGKLVIALGTNATEGWTRGDYQQVVDMLPKSTPIIFVTTYRDPTVWPHSTNFRRRASVQWWYSRWMGHIARERDNICVAPWRNVAAHHRGLLLDGVHPVIGRGTKLWARRVAATVGTCWTNPENHMTNAHQLMRRLAARQ